MINHIKTTESTQDKPVCKIDHACTPAFINFFLKYGISHYAFDLNRTCFMKHVHKKKSKSSCNDVHCVTMQ